MRERCVCVCYLFYVSTYTQYMGLVHHQTREMRWLLGPPDVYVCTWRCCVGVCGPVDCCVVRSSGRSKIVSGQ